MTTQDGDVALLRRMQQLVQATAPAGNMQTSDQICTVRARLSMIFQIVTSTNEWKSAQSLRDKTSANATKPWLYAPKNSAAKPPERCGCAAGGTIWDCGCK